MPYRDNYRQLTLPIPYQHIADTSWLALLTTNDVLHILNIWLQNS